MNPETLTLNDSLPNFPAELKALPIWAPHKGKIAHNPLRGFNASSTDPSTWLSYPEAHAAIDGYDGLAFRIVQPYAFIDLDHCVRGGVTEQWARNFAAQCNSYTEESPSGTGLHIYVKGNLPEAKRKGRKVNGIELYVEKRYSTATGRHLSGTPLTINESLDLEAVRDDIEAGTLRPYKLDKSAEAALDGDIAAFTNDRSKAVYGSLRYLGKKHNGNRDAIVDEFERSQLCADWGDKWPRLKEDELDKLLAEWGNTKANPYGSLLTFDDMRQREHTAEPAIVEGIIRRRSIVLMVGDSSLGKSPLVHQLVWAVATGSRFLDKQTQRGRVLLFDLENPREAQLGFESCFKRLYGQEKSSDNIKMPERPLCNDEGLAQLEHFAESFRPSLICIDAIKSFHAEAEEPGKPCNTFMQRLRKITTTHGCAILLVHHARKQSMDIDKQFPLEDSTVVTSWLTCASGGRGLINQSDTRWAIAAGTDERDCFVMKVNERVTGDGELIHVMRLYDEEGNPAGYTLRAGIDLLSPQQQSHFRNLPQMFSFQEAKRMLEVHPQVVTRLVSRARTAGLLDRKGGRAGLWFKTDLGKRS